jgi:hypothetical protein
LQQCVPGVWAGESARPFGIIACWEAGAAESEEEDAEPQAIPRDLTIGLMVERFNRPPWELGYGSERDVALLNRVLYAAWVYRTAQMARDKDNMIHLSREQLLLIDELRTLSEKHAPTPATRRARKPLRRQRRALA